MLCINNHRSQSHVSCRAAKEQAPEEVWGTPTLPFEHVHKRCINDQVRHKLKIQSLLKRLLKLTLLKRLLKL